MRVALIYSGQLRNFEDNYSSLCPRSETSIDLYFSNWIQRGGIENSKLHRFCETLTLGVLGRKLSFKKVSLVGKYALDKQYDDEVDPCELNRISNNVSLRKQLPSYHVNLDGISMPRELIRQEPVYYRGMLPMLERNYVGFCMINDHEKRGGFKYDFVIRTQGDVNVNFKELVDFLETANPNILYHEITSINPDCQVSTKFVCSGRQIMVTYLSVFPKFESIIERITRTNSTGIIPVGERFFYLYLKLYGIRCQGLPNRCIAVINRQKVKARFGFWFPVTFLKLLGRL